MDGVMERKPIHTDVHRSWRENQTQTNNQDWTDNQSIEGNKRRFPEKKVAVLLDFVQVTSTPPQRPKKSELSGWQLSTRKNFPDEVRKSFSRQKKCA